MHCKSICPIITFGTTFLMRIGHLNVRSLVRHFGEVRDLLIQEKLSILAVTETWVSHGFDINHILIDQYTLIHEPRAAIGGGVAIYAHNDLAPIIIMANITDSCEQ